MCGTIEFKSRKGIEIMCFNFRIIDIADGNQIIDRRLKTPYSALTPLQMVEYIEMDVQLELMDRLERKARGETECRPKLANNPLWKLACLCGFCG